MSTRTDHAVDPTTRDPLVRLRGTFNLRDVGGLPAVGDAASRWGRLFRSDALHALEDDDVAELARRDVNLVIDLRDPVEREIAPSRLDALDAEVVHLPVLDVAPSTFLARDASLVDLYDHILDHGGRSIVSVLRHIAAVDDGAVLVHCTAGKDRTGVVVALALDAVGVDRVSIVADYARTEDHLPVEVLDEIVTRLRGQHDHDSVHLEDFVRRSPVAVLEHAFDRLEREHGSSAAYLQAHGLTDDELVALRRVLVG